MKLNLLKFAVLLMFVTLLSSFVAYRTGYFDKYLYAQNVLPPTVDSPEVAPQTDAHMSSSKSVIMSDFTIKPPDSNSITEEEIRNMPTRSVKDIPTQYMGTTKSGPVILNIKEPQYYYVDGVRYTKSEYDSIKKREALPYKVNNNTQPLTVHTDSIEYEKERMRMVSSKSAYVLDPVRDSALIDAIKRRAASDKGKKTKKQK